MKIYSYIENAISIYNLYTKKSNLKSEMANGEMVNSLAFGNVISNGDMRPARAPGMPEIKRVKIHALEQFIIKQYLNHFSHPNNLE